MVNAIQYFKCDLSRTAYFLLMSTFLKVVVNLTCGPSQIAHTSCKVRLK